MKGKRINTCWKLIAVLLDLLEIKWWFIKSCWAFLGVVLNEWWIWILILMIINSLFFFIITIIISITSFFFFFSLHSHTDCVKQWMKGLPALNLIANIYSNFPFTATILGFFPTINTVSCSTIYTLSSLPSFNSPIHFASNIQQWRG